MVTVYPTPPLLVNDSFPQSIPKLGLSTSAITATIHISTMKTFRRSKQSGDTIVEVLLAITIASFIVVLAYNTTRENNISLQNSQEHTSASGILKSQIETLRSKSGTLQSLIYKQSGAPRTTAQPFCMTTTVAATTVTDFPGSIPANAADDPLTGYPATCKQGLYYVSISYDSTKDDLFTAQARWDSQDGKRQQVVYYYRLPIALLNSSGGDGQVDIGNCGSPGFPACFVFPPGHHGTYHWEDTRYNASNNPHSIISGCSWNWGDGTPSDVYSYPDPADPTATRDTALYRCYYLYSSPKHVYATPANWDATHTYPDGCHTIHYTLTLVLHFNNGYPDTPSNRDLALPECY